MTDKVFVISDGSGYLGQEMCKELVYLGATVYCVGRNREKFRVFDLFFKEADLRDEESASKLSAEIFEAETHIDCLVNNAADTSVRGIDLEQSWL